MVVVAMGMKAWSERLSHHSGMHFCTPLPSKTQTDRQVSRPVKPNNVSASASAADAATADPT